MGSSVIACKLWRIGCGSDTAECLNRMTEIWMGYTTITRAKEQGKLFISGNRQLETTMRSRLSLSPLAKVDKLVA